MPRKTAQKSPNSLQPPSPSKRTKHQTADELEVKDDTSHDKHEEVSSSNYGNPIKSSDYPNTPTKRSLRQSHDLDKQLAQPGGQQTRSKKAKDDIKSSNASKSGGEGHSEILNPNLKRSDGIHVASGENVQVPGRNSGAFRGEGGTTCEKTGREESKLSADSLIHSDDRSSKAKQDTKQISDNLLRPQRSSGRVRTPTMKAAEAQSGLNKKSRNKILNLAKLDSPPSHNQSVLYKADRSGDRRQVDREGHSVAITAKISHPKSQNEVNYSTIVSQSPPDPASHFPNRTSIAGSPAISLSDSSVMDSPINSPVKNPPRSGSATDPSRGKSVDPSSGKSVDPSSGKSVDPSSTTSPAKSPGHQKTARMFIVPKSSGSGIVSGSFDALTPESSSSEQRHNSSPSKTKSSLVASMPSEVNNVLIKEIVVMPDDVLLSLKVKGSGGSRKPGMADASAQVEDDLMGSEVLYLNPNDEAPATDITGVVNFDAVLSSVDIHDKVLGGVSALVKDSLLEIQGMRQFITTDLANFTNVTCFKTADKIAISGTFQGIARTWSILTNIEHHINQQSPFSGLNVQIELEMKNGEKKVITFKRSQVNKTKSEKSIAPVTMFVDIKQEAEEAQSQSMESGNFRANSISPGRSPKKQVSLLSGRSFSVMSSINNDDDNTEGQQSNITQMTVTQKGKKRGRPRKLLQPIEQETGELSDQEEPVETGGGAGMVDGGNNITSEMDDDRDDDCYEHDGDGGKMLVLKSEDEMNIVKCDICCEKFPRGEINSHHTNIHGRRMNNSSSGPEDNTIVIKSRKVKHAKVQVQGNGFPERGGSFVQCSTCTQRFRCRIELTKHQRRAHSIINLLPKSRLTLSHNCHLCGKKFHEKRYLSTHLKRHAGIKNHKCDVCGWRFFEAHKLKFHMETHKREEDRLLPYRCGICQRQYHNRQSWNDHMNTHVGARPYKCPTCSSSFAHRIGLHRHKVTHEKESPFSCSYCGRGFKIRSNLTAHLTVHTRISKHVCKRCGKVFTVGTSLRRHRCGPEDEVVQKYMCGVCNMTFPTLILAEEHSFQHVDNSNVDMNLVGIQVEEVEEASSELAVPGPASISADGETTFVVETDCSGHVVAAHDISALISSAGKIAGSGGVDEAEKIHIAANTLADLSTLSQDADLLAREQTGAVTMVTTNQDREFHQEQTTDAGVKYLPIAPLINMEGVAENSHDAMQNYVNT